MSLGDGERPRYRTALDVELERDGDVVSGDVISAPHGAAQRARGFARNRTQNAAAIDGEDEPDRDRVEHVRPERPAGEVDGAAEREGEASAVGQHRYAGALDRNRSSLDDVRRRPPAASRPDERASGARMSRCASTGAATALTSSGAT